MGAAQDTPPEQPEMPDQPDMQQQLEPTAAQIAALPGLSLLEFGSPWCGICARTQPALHDALQQHPGIRHVKIEDGRGRPLGRGFGVRLWPTLVLLRDGQEIARSVRPLHRQAIAEFLQRGQ